MKEIIAAFVSSFEIDGNTDKPVWNNLLPLSNCVTADTPNRKTAFGVAHDGQYLYFAFKAEDDNIKPIRTEYNSKIYEEEVVEIFLSGKNIKRYVEFEISPNNTQFCGLIKNNMKGSRSLKLMKRSIIESRIVLIDKGFSAEIKVSIKTIANKLNIRDLKECYFNAYRIDRPLDKEWELSALSPTKISGFHYPESFIKLIMEENI